MRAQTLIGMISILWVGMILAIGLENIVIIEGVSLLKPISFEIARAVFGTFNKVQLVLLAALLVPLLTGVVSFFEVSAIFLIAFALFIQIFFIFPVLSQQVDLIVVGIKPPSASATLQHQLYGFLEIVKLSLLTALGFRYMLSLGN